MQVLGKMPDVTLKQKNVRLLMTIFERSLAEQILVTDRL